MGHGLQASCPSTVWWPCRVTCALKDSEPAATHVSSLSVSSISARIPAMSVFSFRSLAATARSSERPTVSAAASRPSLHVERRELALVEAPADPDLVPLARRARRTPCWTSPRGRTRSTGTTSYSCRPPSMFSAAYRPWLNATSQCSIRSRAAVHDAVVLGDVARREDAGRARLQVPVDEHPAVGLSPACSASMMSGVTPAPITTKSHSISRPDFVTTFRTRSSALEALQLLPAVHLHAVLGQHVLEEAPDLGAAHALERDLLEHDISHCLPSAVNEAASSVPM